MRSREIWLTVLMRGVQLNSLTPSNGGATAPISYTQCYKFGGGVTSGTMPYTGGAPPMLWKPPPLAYNAKIKAVSMAFYRPLSERANLHEVRCGISERCGGNFFK